MEANDLSLVDPVRPRVQLLFKELLAELDAMVNPPALPDGTETHISGFGSANALSPPGTANTHGGAPLSSVGNPLSAEAGDGPLGDTAPPQTATAPSTAQSGKRGRATSSVAHGSKKGAAAAAAAAAAEPEPVLEPVVPVLPPPPADPVDDPWADAAAAIAAADADFQQSCDPTLQWSRARLAFFNERAANKYMIEDVLGEWVEADAPALSPFALDPFAIARDHTAHLEKTYGYRAPRGLHEVGKVTPRVVTTDSLQEKIADHDAGGATAPPDFVCGDTVAKNATLRASAAAAPVPAPTPPSASARAKASPARTATTLRRTATSVVPNPIELSSSELAFVVAPGAADSVDVRLWNRDGHRLRVKLDQSPSPWVSVAPKDAAVYDPETPLNPGEHLDIVVGFCPPDTSNPDFTVAVRIGYARETNQFRETEASHITRQWTFVELPVRCRTVLPSLVLADGTASVAFEPLLAFSQASRVCRFTNRGSRGSFAVVVVPADGGASGGGRGFSIEPREFDLEAGATANVTVNFCPEGDGDAAAALRIITREHPDSAVLSDEPAAVALSGRGVVPSVVIESVGDSRLRPDEVSDAAAANAELATVAFADPAAGHTSVLRVVVRSDCPLPLPCSWRAALVGDGGKSTLRVVPPRAVLAPDATTTFEAQLASASGDAPLAGVLSLFLEGMPSATGRNIAAAVPFYARDKRLPLPLPVAPADNHCDPHGLFAARDADATAASGEQLAPDVVFAGAVRVSAEPTPLRVSVAPGVLETAVPCLTLTENRREFVLTNHSNRPVHFWLDPPTGGFHPSVMPHGGEELAALTKKMRAQHGDRWAPPSKRDRDTCALSFSPQRGVLAGRASVTVSCVFTLLEIGPHVIDVECFVPELVGEDAVLPALTLIANGVGPTVHVSESVLDFGVIAVNAESERFVTVTNHNPVPLEFAVIDPEAPSAESGLKPRFTFLPPAAHLLPGRSVDVTVYRTASAEPNIAEQGCVEFIVRGGGTTAVEVRASVQQPALSVWPAICDVGETDRDIPVESAVYLTNLSAIDIPFHVVPVRIPSETMKLQLPPGGTLMGGQAKAALRLRAVFSGAAPSTAVIAVTSPLLVAPVLFEVTCSAVRQLAVSLALAPFTGYSSGTGGLLTAAVAPAQSAGAFVRDLLTNALSAALGGGGAAAKRADVAPHCAPLVVPFAEIDDSAPYCAVRATLTIENRSGCESSYGVSVASFTPFDGEFREPAALQLARTGSMLGGAGRLATTKSGTRLTTLRRMSSTAGRESNVSQRIIALKPDRPAYQCKALDGRADAEATSAAQLAVAQALLADGKGMAIRVDNASGPLRPHATQEVTATLVANLPGEYCDTLTFECNGLPSIDLDVRMTVRGRPILIDPTTSGLGKDEATGALRLALPAVVAGMSSTKRRVRIASRCPRDLDVRVALVDANAAFGVTLVAGDARAVLHGRASGGGLASAMEVSPATLMLPAMTSAEIVISFAPPAVDPNDAARETDVRCTLTIASTFAATEYNDVFLLDEFYRVNAERYPAMRALTALPLLEATKDAAGAGPSTATPAAGAAAASSAAAGSPPPTRKAAEVVRGVFAVTVQLPLIDRPNVVAENVILRPPPAEELLIEQHARRLAQQEASLRRASVTPQPAAQQQQHSRAAVDSDEEDAADAEAAGDARSLETLAPGREKAQVLADEAERIELRAYIARRRVEVAAASAQFLLPLRVVVVGRCLAAALRSDPPEVIRFPLCRAGDECTRTVRLTNPTMTPLDFRAELAAPFRVVRIGFVPADGAEDVLEEDDEEGRTARRNVLALETEARKFGATAAAAGASSIAKLMQPVSKIGASRSAKVATHGDPANTLFHLRPRDAVDLTVQLALPSTLSAKQTINGEMRLVFVGASVLPQCLPLLATVHVPTLVCEPDVAWFRPGVALHDGRPQPKHERSITLANYSLCDASFVVEHAPAELQRAGSASSATGGALTRLRRVQQVVNVSPLEAHAPVVDDPSRFTVFPLRGVVPAASAGGQPGKLVLHLGFDECSNVRFESRFLVKVEGGAGSEFVIRGDSRETEV